MSIMYKKYTFISELSFHLLLNVASKIVVTGELVKKY